MLTKLFGAAVQGINATIVTIEVNSSRGIRFFLVGLPDSAVKESHPLNPSFIFVGTFGAKLTLEKFNPKDAPTASSCLKVLFCAWQIDKLAMHRNIATNIFFVIISIILPHCGLPYNHSCNVQ